MKNLSEIIAVACDECNGAGFVFFGDENNYDVEPCNCVNKNNDELTLDWTE
jgi:hypothetical protein